MNIGAITASLQGYSQGKENLEKRRQLQRQEAIQDTQQAQGNQKFELQIQQLEQQLKQQKTETMKIQGKEAMKNYLTSGSIYGLNQIAKNPEHRQAFGGYTGYSMVNGVLSGTKILPDGSTKVVPIPKEQLVQWGIGTGAQQEIDDYNMTKKATKAKTKYQQAQTSKLEAGTKQQALETDSANAWLKANPTKTYIDYENQKKSSEGKRDTLQQLEEAAKKAQDTSLSPKDHKIAIDNYSRLLGGQSQIRTNKNIKDIVSAQDMGFSLLKGTITAKTNERYTKEAEFIDTKAYEIQKPAIKAFNSSYDTYKVAMDLNTQLNEAIAKGDYESGPIVSALHSLAKYTPKEIRDYIEDSSSFEAKLNIDTQTSNYLADVLHQISGTAVANDEFMRRLKDTIGSSSYDTKTKQLTFKSALQFNKAKLIQSAETLVKHGMVGDIYDKWMELKFGDTPMPKTKISQKPKTKINQKDITYDSQYNKFSSLIGQVNPKTNKKLVGIQEEYPFNPIWEENK